MLYVLANAANVEGWRLDLVRYIHLFSLARLGEDVYLKMVKSFSCFYSASITFKNLKN